MSRIARASGVALIAAAWMFCLPAWGGDSTTAGEKDACTAPADLTRLEAPLPATAARLSARQPLTIVAIGSSSTEGVGASAPERAYPSRLAAELANRFPAAPARVVNKGVGGETTPQMLARFDRDVLALGPDLVIWQLGTNLLLRNQSIADNRQAMRDGVARLQAAGIDVIIMDPQYAPRVIARPGHLEIVEQIAAVGRENGISVFRRFAIMRHWADGGDQRAMQSEDKLHMNDLAHQCLARLLASAIAERVRGEGRRPSAPQ